MRHRRISATVFIAAVVLALALPGTPALATGLTVTKTADTNDGVCDADCSLREAVLAANSGGAFYDSINVPAGTYVLTIPGAGEEAGATGDLDITVPLSIVGAGAGSTIIDGNGASLGDRVMQVASGDVFVLSGVTIRNGNTAGEGGGLYAPSEAYISGSTFSGNRAAVSGGGIYSSGYMEISGSTVSGNLSSSGLFGGIGGGIYAAPGTVLSVNSTTITGNGSLAGGGILNDGAAVFVTNSTVNGNTGSFDGGGILSSGDLTVTNSTVSGNASAFSGGGIRVNFASAAITNSILSGNSAGAGGGLFMYAGTLTATNSTVSDNSADEGGGIYNSGSTATVTNSTISGNIANRGAGLYNESNFETVSIVRSTLSGNAASVAGGGIFIDTGGIAIRDSIVANSPSGGNCGGFQVTSNSHNLSSDGTCPFAGTGDKQNTNPLLGPLAFNGGPTPTHALMDGSPAADAGDIPCPQPGSTVSDQRGVSRPQGFRCDIGAYEAPDTDGDGVADPLDNDDDNDGLPDTMEYASCRLLAEDYDGFQDTDGCPEPDNDGDAVCDAGQASVSCTGSDTGRYCFDPAGTLSCPTTDCRNAAEDLDAFKDTDGCPEPDNDNDSFPDVTDTCPGTDAGTGANGMFGAPQDANHNGIRDGAEAVFTTDDVLTYAFEDRDGVLDTDGCHDSPGEDFDGDGYADDDEALKIGTNAGYPCGNSGWPSDLVSAGSSLNKVDIFDLISFVAPVRLLDKSPGPGSPYNARWDLKPGATFPFPNHINIVDITTLTNGPAGGPAYPPMLGGVRAFDKTCPLAPQ